jgi:hypothetical protein
MADIRRRNPEPPPETPKIQHKPGLTRQMLRELAPLLAEEGIDVDNIDVPDLDTLIPPEAPDGESATVAGCTGVALGLLDEWLSGHHPAAPASLARQTALPAGHWTGERAAADILALAAKRRAFGSLHTLTVRQGGQHVLYGSALALAAAARAWSRHTGTPVTELARAEIR